MKVTVKYGTMFGEPQERQYDIEIPKTGNLAHALEITFRYMNRVNDDPCERQLNELKERSMSVGDSVVIAGNEFLCKPYGWEARTNEGKELLENAMKIAQNTIVSTSCSCSKCK